MEQHDYNMFGSDTEDENDRTINDFLSNYDRNQYPFGELEPVEKWMNERIRSANVSDSDDENESKHPEPRYDSFVNQLKQRELEPFADSPIRNVEEKDSDEKQDRGRNTEGFERYREFMSTKPPGVSLNKWRKKWSAQEGERKNENKKQNAQNKQQKGKLEKKRRGRKG